MLGEWMEKEIREQPELLAIEGERYGSELRQVLQGREFSMVLLAARGSSDHAALFARYLFEVHLGIPVSLAAPSVLTRYGRRIKYSRCLAIGISQSGEAPDVAEILAALKEDGHLTVGITNTQGSRIDREAEFGLQLGVGKERSVAATKTYSASLLALYQLARVLGAQIPSPQGLTPNSEWIAQTEAESHLASGIVLRSSPVFSLGRGYSFATANETALKLMECALIPCKSYSTADFEHGPKALAGHGSAAISFDGVSGELENQGCEIIQAPRRPNSVPPELAPIWDVAFGQWIALHAARARALDPDDPRHIQKVTRTL